MLRYHCRHQGTAEEEEKKKKSRGRERGGWETRHPLRLGKRLPNAPNELDLLGEICQTLYHTRGVLSEDCNIVELQTLRHRRSLSNKQLPYATTACLSFILIYLLSRLPARSSRFRSRHQPLFRRRYPSFFSLSPLINVQF